MEISSGSSASSSPPSSTPFVQHPSLSNEKQSFTRFHFTKWQGRVNEKFEAERDGKNVLLFGKNELQRIKGLESDLILQSEALRNDHEWTGDSSSLVLTNYLLGEPKTLPYTETDPSIGKGKHKEGTHSLGTIWREYQSVAVGLVKPWETPVLPFWGFSKELDDFQKYQQVYKERIDSAEKEQGYFQSTLCALHIQSNNAVCFGLERFSKAADVDAFLIANSICTCVKKSSAMPFQYYIHRPMTQRNKAGCWLQNEIFGKNKDVEFMETAATFLEIKHDSIVLNIGSQVTPFKQVIGDLYACGIKPAAVLCEPIDTATNDFFYGTQIRYPISPRAQQFAINYVCFPITDEYSPLGPLNLYVRLDVALSKAARLDSTTLERAQNATDSRNPFKAGGSSSSAPGKGKKPV